MNIIPHDSVAFVFLPSPLTGEGAGVRGNSALDAALYKRHSAFGYVASQSGKHFVGANHAYSNPSPPAPLPQGERGVHFLAAVLVLLLLAGCQQQMAEQPSYKPLDESTFFDDGRSARDLVAGTVARGHLRTDVQLYTGRRT